MDNKNTTKIVEVGNISFGGEQLVIIGGSCAVEGEKQFMSIAEDVKKAGAHMLRGGAFKPRTSPHSFQGLGREGIEILQQAKESTGLPFATELMSIVLAEYFAENVDVIQIGSRNMHNYELLKEVGRYDIPVILKRGMGATIKEWLMAAEYIVTSGNDKVILCERGIRTFENATRNTLDLSAIPLIKKLSNFPIIVDPSHAAGEWWMVEDLSKAAIAAGADGLMIEVHNEPESALSDGQQSIKPNKFKTLIDDLKLIAKAVNRKI